MTKIVIKNIYYMLTYVFQVLKRHDYKEIASEEFDNIYDLFAAILAKGIAQQLKQGLYREYREKTEVLHSLHGKLDIDGTLRCLPQRKRQLSCNLDELSEDNIYNRIIKTTAELLLKKATENEYKDTLRKELRFFNTVSMIDPAAIRRDSLRFTRSNQTYRMLINICTFVLSGLLLTTEKGKYKLASFFDDKNMCYLYEHFILEFYRKEYPAINVRARQIEWQTDDGITALLPVMQSDIMLSYKEKTLIIDAKYYSRTMQTREEFDSRTLRSNHLYQIFAYVKNYQVFKNKQSYGKNLSGENTPPDGSGIAGKSIGNVSGLLLYARTDEKIQPDNDYLMSGNKISVKTLDLNRDFKIIKAQLADIANSLLTDCPS